MWFTELFKLDKIRDRITSQESKRVLVSILFSQGGPFSSEADIQRCPGLKKKIQNITII